LIFAFRVALTGAAHYEAYTHTIRKNKVFSKPLFDPALKNAVLDLPSDHTPKIADYYAC
jgi:hypothetical protein